MPGKVRVRSHRLNHLHSCYEIGTKIRTFDYTKFHENPCSFFYTRIIRTHRGTDRKDEGDRHNFITLYRTCHKQACKKVTTVSVLVYVTVRRVCVTANIPGTVPLSESGSICNWFPIQTHNRCCLIVSQFSAPCQLYSGTVIEEFP